MMDDKRLQEIKARAEAATPGPWKDIYEVCDFADAARIYIHDMIAEVDRLRAENTRLRAELEGLRATYEAAGMIIGYWERLYAAEHTKVKRLESELEAAKARWEETASDGTGYTLSHLDGIFSVSDPQGHVVCEFLRERAENGGKLDD